MTLRERIESWVSGGAVAHEFALATWRRIKKAHKHLRDPDALEFISRRQASDGREILRVTHAVTYTYDIILDTDPDAPDRVEVELVET
jgi:hypothetical protein